MADQQEIARRIRKVVMTQFSPGLREEDFAWSERLDEIVALDSMASLELVIALEKEFSITIEAEHLDQALLRELPRLRDYIARRMT